jgi:hypothetical protein
MVRTAFTVVLTLYVSASARLCNGEDGSQWGGRAGSHNEFGGHEGRADYYGALANLAARVSALAAPGQILVEGSAGFRNEAAWERRDDGWALLPRLDGAKDVSLPDMPIELEQLGYYMLKVSNPNIPALVAKFQQVPLCAKIGDLALCMLSTEPRANCE